jgi:DNA uptake protein ComE-like DNA-binding protein
MGMIQKVLWWILYYAVTWFCLVIVWGIIEDTGVFPKAFTGFLIIAVFLVPGWYANRKVKQKALKKEMEQRATNLNSTQQPVQPPFSPAPPPMPQSTPTPIPQPASIAVKNTGIAPNEPHPPIQPPPQNTLPNFNNATLEELTKLSGVNRILAMKIISVRDKDGAYSSFEDLFSRVKLTPQAQEEIRHHYSITLTSDGRFIDF